MDVAEEVGGELVVAGGEAAAVLNAAEHSLDGVAAFVKGLAEAAFPAPVALGRDVGDRALLLDQVADAFAVIGAVGVTMQRDGRPTNRCSAVLQSAAWPGVSRKASGRLWRSVMAWTLSKSSGQAWCCVRPGWLDRLVLRPPFPPPAERCAFTCVLSIRTTVGGPLAAANVSNTSRQTPLAAERTLRL